MEVEYVQQRETHEGGIAQQTKFDDTGGYRHRHHGCVLSLYIIITIITIIIFIFL